jgi:hypothetical protein
MNSDRTKFHFLIFLFSFAWRFLQIVQLYGSGNGKIVKAGTTFVRSLSENRCDSRMAVIPLTLTIASSYLYFKEQQRGVIYQIDLFLFMIVHSIFVFSKSIVPQVDCHGRKLLSFDASFDSISQMKGFPIRRIHPMHSRDPEAVFAVLIAIRSVILREHSCSFKLMRTRALG